MIPSDSIQAPRGGDPAGEAEPTTAATPKTAAGGQAPEMAQGVPERVPPETSKSERRLHLKAVGEKLLKDPIGGVQQGVQQVVDVLGEGRGVALGWAAALILSVLSYLVDLGAGSLWNGDDALVALAAIGLREGSLSMVDAMHTVPPPTGVPLGLWQIALVVALLGPGEAALRLLPALAAIGCAFCLLAIAIDTGVGRRAGGLGGLVLLALPLCYELSHRAVPDMLIAFASTAAVALTTHCLHGHKFDRHILPHHSDEEAPQPLPLRRWTMALAAIGIGVASLVDPRAGLMAIVFALLDMLLAHRGLLRKRRVWAMLFAATMLTCIAAGLHPGGLGAWLRPPSQGALKASVGALWGQGPGWYGRHVGPVVIVAAAVGMLLGSLRRPSRPLLCWVVVAIIMNALGPTSPPPRGLGLVLPPLALCAAVGLEAPSRWLGHLGMVVSAGALAGILFAVYEGTPVLHRDDTVKVLALSQRRAPADALLCTVGIPAAAASLYSGRQVRAFATVAELHSALGPEQPLSCIMPPAEARLLQRHLAAPVPLSPPLSPEARHARGARRRFPAPQMPASIESVLATVLDIEEPPPDTTGPRLVLVSR
ncbi:MAG: hypothetical protein RMK29_12840 [Myxococcales bacterium]|nr:hypothetical protein [Myxococcota bacterium]MDW8282591.1 hypothetical protein [Myxococcales bacterium]